MILEYVAARRMVRNIAIDVNLVDPRSRSDSLIDKGEQEKRLECNEMRAVSESFNREREPESNPKGGEKGRGGPSLHRGSRNYIHRQQTPEYKELNTRHDSDGYWRSTQTNSGNMICQDSGFFGTKIAGCTSTFVSNAAICTLYFVLSRVYWRYYSLALSIYSTLPYSALFYYSILYSLLRTMFTLCIYSGVHIYISAINNRHDINAGFY